MAEEKTARQSIAEKAGAEFRALPEEAKEKFVYATLTTLMALKPKQARNLIKKFFKRGRPSQEDLETINHLVIMFLYSIKEEYRFMWAYLVYRALGQAPPESLSGKIEAAMGLKYLHLGVKPETYEAFNALAMKLQADGADAVLRSLLEAEAKLSGSGGV